jgi:hypothetical protein
MLKCIVLPTPPKTIVTDLTSRSGNKQPDLSSWRAALHDSALVGRVEAAFNTLRDIALDRDHQFRSSDRFGRARYGNGFGVDRGFGDGCRDGLGRCNGQGGG